MNAPSQEIRFPNNETHCLLFFTSDNAQVQQRAFETVYKLYRNYVFTICQKICRIRKFPADDATLEELVQEVFTNVFRFKSTFDTTRPLKNWLRRIAVNVATGHIDSFHTGKRNRLLEIELDKPLPSGKTLQEHLTAAQTDLINLLANEQMSIQIEEIVRSVTNNDNQYQIFMMYLQDHSSVEIGKVVGSSPNSVRNIIATVKERFDAIIKERFPELPQRVYE